MTDDADRERLDRQIAPLGIAYELFACDPALADTAAFCAAYGFELGDSANTIVVVGKSEPRQYAACVVLATHRLDVNRAVRARFGRGKASFASAEETRELTGQEIGGVTTFGLPPGLPIWVDAAVMATDADRARWRQPLVEGARVAGDPSSTAKRRGRDRPCEPCCTARGDGSARPRGVAVWRSALGRRPEGRAEMNRG